MKARSCNELKYLRVILSGNLFLHDIKALYLCLNSSFYLLVINSEYCYIPTVFSVTFSNEIKELILTISIDITCKVLTPCDSNACATFSFRSLNWTKMRTLSSFLVTISLTFSTIFVSLAPNSPPPSFFLFVSSKT